MNRNLKQIIAVKLHSEEAFPLGWLIIGILLLLAFMSTGYGQAATSPTSSDSSVSHIESFGFTVSDMDKVKKPEHKG